MALETKSDWAYAIIGFIIVVAVAIGGVWAFNKLTWQPSFQVENETAQEEGVTMTFVSGTEYKPGQEGQVIVELRDIYGNPLTGNTSVLTNIQTIATGATTNPNNAETDRFHCTKFRMNIDATITELIVAGDGAYTFPTKCTVFSDAGDVLTEGTLNASRSYSYGWGCVLAPNMSVYQGMEFYGCMNGTGVHRSVDSNQTLNSPQVTPLGQYYGNAYPLTPGNLNGSYNVQMLRMAYVSPACVATVWYPDKTRYIDEQPMRQSDLSGNAFINFTVPSIDGVYEYQAECYAKGKWHLNSKSFHVTQQRIKAVVVK